MSEKAIVKRYGNGEIRVTAFCRCGSSSRKAYCDGSHARVGFSG